MIYKFPGNTEELFKELEQAVARMPQKDRNLFVLDLVKFCLDWQFAYLSMNDNDPERQ